MWIAPCLRRKGVRETTFMLKKWYHHIPGNRYKLPGMNVLALILVLRQRVLLMSRPLKASREKKTQKTMKVGAVCMLEYIWTCMYVCGRHFYFRVWPPLLLPPSSSGYHHLIILLLATLGNHSDMPWPQVHRGVCSSLFSSPVHATGTCSWHMPWYIWYMPCFFYRTEGSVFPLQLFVVMYTIKFCPLTPSRFERPKKVHSL